MKRLILGIAVLVMLVGIGRVDAAVHIQYVTVGDAGNAGEQSRIDLPEYPDSNWYGGVNYEYRIGKYEVTNSQYTEFLNAVAKVDDPNGLYSEKMGGGWQDIGGISRGGSAGSYTYSVRENRGNRPVNYVSFYNAMRFANWLHNGQLSGAQDMTTTEGGAYLLNGGNPPNASIIREVDATVWIPSDEEWYKAAYYKGGGTDAGYWKYPTQSDERPTSEAPPGTDTVNGSANYWGDDPVDPTYWTTEVGAYTDSPSAYGTFDQAGNLFEWTEELVAYGTGRLLRGGSFHLNYTRAMQSDWHYSDGSPATYAARTYGFRVASAQVIPEPSTLIIWSFLGALGTGYGWYRRMRAA